MPGLREKSVEQQLSDFGDEFRVIAQPVMDPFGKPSDGSGLPEFPSAERPILSDVQGMFTRNLPEVVGPQCRERVARPLGAGGRPTEPFDQR